MDSGKARNYAVPGFNSARMKRSFHHLEQDINKWIPSKDTASSENATSSTSNSTVAAFQNMSQLEQAYTLVSPSESPHRDIIVTFSHSPFQLYTNT